MRLSSIAVPVVLCAVGVMGAIANTCLVRAAAGSGMTSDPGYYERALAWDGQMEASAAAARLGVTFRVSMSRQGATDARLCVAVVSASGGPLSATAVTTSSSANLCPRARVETSLERTGDQHCTVVPNACAGVWVVGLRALVDGQAVAGSERVELGSAP